MIVVPFRAEHLRGLVSGDDWMGSEMIVQLEGSKAVTFIADGVVLLCCGAFEMWPGRFLAWARVNADAARPHVLAVNREARKFLQSVDARRIEANVACGVEVHHRWLRLLGFKLETDRMPKFFPDGSDAAMYVILKE